MSSIEEINLFLMNVKKLIAENKMTFIPRPKNNLSELGINISIVKDIIMNLTYKNYYNGPKEDYSKNHVGFVWEFGKDEDTYQVYIKLKIKETKKGDMLVILSFHKAERPIIYKY